MKFNPRSFLIIALFSLMLPACTKQIRPSLHPLPEVIKLDASLDELLHLYQQRLKLKTALKALIEVKADLGKRGKHTFQSAWRSDRNRVKMKGFNLFGGTLFELDLRASKFSVNIPLERKFFEGELEYFDAMTDGKIPLGSLALLEWVKRGGIPELGPKHIPALEKQDDVFILYIFSTELGLGFLKEKIWIERTAFRVKKVELYDRNGLRKGTIIFDNYRKIEGQFFPFSITGNSRGQILELNFNEVSFPSDPFLSGRKSQ